MTADNDTNNSENSLEELDKQSWISVALGTIVVIVVGLLVFNYFTQLRSQPGDQTADDDTQTEEQMEADQDTDTLPTTHTVSDGEYLSEIAKQYYGDGNYWVELAEVNKIDNPDVITEGTKLTIPDLDTGEQSPAMKAKEDTETGPESYTVQKGDNLCKIGRNLYNDCRRGLEIADLNNLRNPDIIYPGQVLQLPQLSDQS